MDLLIKKYDLAKISIRDLNEFIIDQLHDQDPEILYEFLVSWIRLKDTERSQYTHELMQRVEFSKMKNSFLATIGVDEKIFYTLDLKRFILDAWGRKLQETELVAQCNPCPHRNYLLLTAPNNAIAYTFYKRRIDECIYTQISQPPGPLNVSYGLTCSDSGLMFCAGGNIFGVAASNVYAYDVSIDMWSSLPDMAHARWAPGLIVHENSLYAIGGYRFGKHVRKQQHYVVEKYDLRCGHLFWMPIKGLPRAMSPSIVFSCDEFIYAYAPWDAEDIMLRYDTKMEQWSQVDDSDIDLYLTHPYVSLSTMCNGSFTALNMTSLRCHGLPQICKDDVPSDVINSFCNACMIRNTIYCSTGTNRLWKCQLLKDHKTWYWFEMDVPDCSPSFRLACS